MRVAISASLSAPNLESLVKLKDPLTIQSPYWDTPVKDSTGQVRGPTGSLLERAEFPISIEDS